MVIIAAAVGVIVVLLLVLAIVPLGTAVHPGSTNDFSQPAQAATADGYTLYLVNLTFSASKGVSVQLTWATNQSEELCAVGVVGPAAGVGYGPAEGAQYCTGSYDFTSQGGAFYFIIDAPATFAVDGSVTIGPLTVKAPIL